MLDLRILNSPSAAPVPRGVPHEALTFEAFSDDGGQKEVMYDLNATRWLS